MGRLDAEKLDELILREGEPPRTGPGNPCGCPPVLPEGGCARVARRLNLTLGQVQVRAVELGIMPARYLRNLNALSLADQGRLLRARVAVVGLGGLGGPLVEMLARMGVGRIRGADFDCFEESNLNRQLFCATPDIGRLKAEAAAERVLRVNPAVTFRGVPAKLERRDMPHFLRGVDLAVDALGGLAHRLALEESARAAGVPLVTGAVAGWTGYVAVVQPGAAGPASLLGQGGGAEDDLGTQAPTVWATASLMAGEVVKLLTQGDSPLAGRMMVCDYQNASFETLQLS